MPDTNQPFWEKFKAMFADPVQRKTLVDFFDECVQDLTANPKPIRVAVVGIYSQFQACISELKWAIPICDLSEEKFLAKGIELVYVGDEEEAQGIQVDYYCLASDSFPTRVMELCAYMVARNIPAIKRRDLYKEIESRLNPEPCNPN